MAPSDENVEHRPPLKIMVIGDSISQGREGDWTWRYRIWEWLHAEKVCFVFVGPFQGTEQPEQPSPPRPPPLPSEPAWPPSPFRSNGEYASGVSAAFHANSCHFAAGGRQAAQAKDLVAEQVAAFQPDLCLVQLGFNDLSWCVSGPEDTLASVKCLVDRARAASVNPGGLGFAIADIPHRTPVEGREDLPANTNVYNTLLARAIPTWRTPESPVALVRFCENYSCGKETSAGAYDGLHPNALGEYELAQAFSRALVDDLGLGRRALRIPPHVPARPVPEPANVRAAPSPCGVVVTWDPVFGAYGYDVRERLASSSSSSSSSSPDGDDDDDDGAWTAQYFAHSNRHDTTRCVTGTMWEYRVRARAGDRVASAWSGIVRAVANPQTLPGPARIVTHATAAGFAVAWDPPPESGGDEIDRYGVFWLDLDVPGAFPSAAGVRATAVVIGAGHGVVKGHHYAVAVDTWTKAGGGLPAGARSVTPGCGTPNPPVRVRAVVVDATTVDLAWLGDDAAAGYRVWARSRRSSSSSAAALSSNAHGAGSELAPPPAPVLCDAGPDHASCGRRFAASADSASAGSHRLTGLLPSAWDFEFAVSAYNGDDDSDVSVWVVPPPPTLAEESSISIDIELVGNEPAQGVSA